MKLKALIVALALMFGLTVNSASAQTYSFTTKLIDTYRGANGGLFYDGPVIQSDLFISFQNGLYGDLWVSRGGKAGWMDEFDSEVDYNAGWANNILDLGVMYIDVSTLAASDVFQLYTKLSTREFQGGLRGRFVVEHYLAMSGNDPARGTITRLHVMQSRVLGRGSLDWKLGAFYDTGAFGFAEGTVGEGEVSLLYNMGRLSVGPLVKCTAPISLSRDDGRESGCAFGIVIKPTF
ncbi:MAG: hypothetical protein RLY47_153 [Candidatus Parcubacteria bacterium]|jgi:hypothetical protein